MRSAPSSNVAVIELRNYPMRPFGRDSFIDNFEAHYLEEIERCGAIAMGQFRVVGDPDRFVWLRGYADIVQREPSLRGFYAGDIWKRHGPISKALFLRPLTVRLLRPLNGTDLTAGGTLAATLSAFAAGTCSVETGLVVLNIFRVAEAHRRDELVDMLRGSAPALEGADSEIRGLLVAEERQDGWDEEVIRDQREVVLMTAHRDGSAAERHAEVISAITSELGRKLSGAPMSLALLPTMRSAMRYR